MRIGNFIKIIMLLVIALATFEAHAICQEPPGFAKNKAEAIEKGFVFWNGSYLEPPYVFSCHGLALYLNDVELVKAPEWPPYDYRVNVDPGIPDVTEESTWEDIENNVDSRDAHWRRKVRYLYQHYPAEEAKKLIITYFRSLPFMKSVEPESENSSLLVICENSGHKRLVDVGKMEIGPPPTWEEMVALLDQRKSFLEERLLKGDCYFFFEGGSYITFGERKAARILPEAVRILRSMVSFEEKRRRLVELEILPKASKTFDGLITGFQADRSLDQRIAELEGLLK